MKHLHENWLTTGDIDFETKQYQLFAYLQHVEKNTATRKLYPHLEELRRQQEVLSTFLSQFHQFNESIFQELKGFDLKQKRLVYESTLAKTEVSIKLEEIAQFALPYIDNSYQYSSNLSQEYLSTIEFQPIGIIPEHLVEGYAFLYHEQMAEVDIYRYHLKRVQLDNDLPLEISYLGRKIMRISESFSSLKLELVKTFTEWPNPATFLLRPMSVLPVKETLIPLFKKRLFQGVSQLV